MSPTAYSATLETTITPEMDQAIARVVEATGISKAFIVRQAIAVHLAQLGVLPPEVVDELGPVPTRGRGLAATRKRKAHG